MMNKRKLQIWLPLLLAMVMIAGMVIGYRVNDNIPHTASFFKAVNKRSAVQEVIDLINLKYVDSIGADTLADDAINEMLTRLDPHSIYIPPAVLTDVNEDLQGNFQGIGVEYQIFKDTVNIVSVLPGGPSEKAGLEIGDKILQVEDSLVAGNHVTSARIRSLLRGPGKSSVKISISRSGTLKPFTIVRGIIPLPSVDAAYMVDAQTGYIRISKFSETTYEEFMQSLENLQKSGLKKLVLDLRGNGGGILSEAIDIADEFLSADKLIVYTQGAKNKRQDYRCKRNGLFEEGPLAVLVDENTASASEVLSGALQDWDRATIIGRRTFGKGLVQEQYDLSNGAALRLTVARYYTPTGRSIQKAYTGKDEAYQEDILNRYHHGDMVNADSNNVKIGKAFKTIKGRTVYGGGGIMPDEFVAFDTSSFSPVVSRLYAKNALSNYAYQYYIEHKVDLKQFKSAQDYNQHFHGEEQLWQGLSGIAADSSIAVSGSNAKDKAFLEQRMKALLARMIWRNDGYYEVLNGNDPTYLRGLEAVKKG